MHEKQLAQLLDGGDDPDTYAEEEYRLRQQIADHIERRTTTKPVCRDPKEGDVALEDYRLNEVDKYRREKLADVVRAKIEDKRREASEDYWTIRRAEEDAKVDAEVEKMIDAQRRLLPSFSSRILTGDSTAPKDKNTSKTPKDPKEGDVALENYRLNEADKYRREEFSNIARANIESRSREESNARWAILHAAEDAEHDRKVQDLLDAQRRPLPSVSSLILADDSTAPKPEKAAPKPGFDALSQFMDSEAKEHRVNVESGIWNIAALCDPEVTLPNNTIKTNLGRPGPGPFPMGAR